MSLINCNKHFCLNHSSLRLYNDIRTVSTTKNIYRIRNSNVENTSGFGWSSQVKGEGFGDMLYELGNSDLNILSNGQNSEILDSLFAGNFLGQKSDIADGSLRNFDFRTFNNIIGEYHVPPRFTDKISMHVIKNYLANVQDDFKKAPLILAVWGSKGNGKSFQTELTLQKMGIEPIIMSAGELESETAGKPGQLIRERYRRASEASKVQGKPSCLIINDIDAGVGRFDNTQVTVNNQTVMGTLMNLCDDPTRSNSAENWNENEKLMRVPIIVTGNDLSTLYAPILRDGRMDKFFWEPEEEEILNIVHQIFKDDDVSKDECKLLIDSFPKQPLDFFAAIRSSAYDDQIKSWIDGDIMNFQSANSPGVNLSELTQRLLTKQNIPSFQTVCINLELLIKEGHRLQKEQQLVFDNKLSKGYFKNSS